MKKALIWVVGVALLVGIIAGASALYSSLDDEYRPDSIGQIDPPKDQENTTPDNNDDNDTNNDANNNDANNNDASQNENEGDNSEGSEENSDTGLSNPAPDFTVFDRDGNAVKLSDMRGKPVVINFWATWCPYCVEEMPAFENVYNKYKDDVIFMMINATEGSETIEKAGGFVDRYGYTFPVYFDTTQEAVYAYYASSLPISFFIDAKGNLVAYGKGMLNESGIERGIGMALDKQ